MNTLDIILLIILSYFAYRGFVNGLIYELASIVALILGAYLTVNFSHITQNYLVNELNINFHYIGVVAFVLTFILVVFVVHLFAKLITTLVNTVALGPINKLGGALFGAAKIFVVLAVIVAVVENFYSLNAIQIAKSSTIFGYVEGMSQTVFQNVKDLINQI